MTKIDSTVNMWYTDTVALSWGGDTKYFKISVGVLQTVTLFPFLFIIAIDYAVRLTMKNKKST